MQKPPEVETAIERGLRYLASQQAADGSFTSFSSPTKRSFKPLIPTRTTFVQALIVSSLAKLTSPEAKSICERLSTFLLTQSSATGAFNYWVRESPERQNAPYPDDLDDTFCALSGLYLYRPSLVDEAMLAKMVKLLLATETAVGGPYRTWLVPATSKAAWQDVDIAVNSNVAYFLSLIGIELPKVHDLMDRAILTDRFDSPYYPNNYPVIYYMARAYQGSHKALLLRKARQAHKAAGCNELHQALCLIARLHLSEANGLAAPTARLLSQQQANGGWAARAYCADPTRARQRCYNGAAALTTAFVLEALQLYSDTINQPVVTVPIEQQPEQVYSPRAQVLAKAKEQCQAMAPELGITTYKLLDKLAHGSNGPEIIDLPWHFNASLTQPTRKIPKAFLTTLSLGNLYGWLAYTVYDDMIDDNAHPRFLPSANIAMRNSWACFTEALPFHRPFQQLVRRTFDTIDGSSAWELAHCRLKRNGDSLIIDRLPDYGDLRQLAGRSLGHILPPLAILLTAGIDDGNIDFKQLRQALVHYLIARQLNDDTHDWAIDLANGHVSYVVARLLASGHGAEPGQYPLSSLLASARCRFWHSTLPVMCQEIQQHIDLARQSLRQVSILRSDNIIASMLNTMEISVTDTLDKYGQAKSFLKHYGNAQVKS